MSFSMPIQWFHSHEDPIWPEGTFNINLFDVYSAKIVPLLQSSIQLLKLLSVNKFNQHRYSIHFQSSHTTLVIFNSVYCIHFTRALRHLCHHPHRMSSCRHPHTHSVSQSSTHMQGFTSQGLILQNE
jgi:hypothetical protein